MPVAFRLGRLLSVLALPLLGLVGGAGGATASPVETPAATERWYEIRRDGHKLGHSCVVWAPSTWEGRPTVHDTTTIVQRSVRNMLGIRDTFEFTVSVDLERGDDGTLWWMRVVVEEAGRVTTEEQTWTGAGYEHVTRRGGEEQRLTIPLDAPVMVDSEAFLGAKIRAGKVKPGDRFELRTLDVEARAAQVVELVIEGREEVPDLAAAGPDEEEVPRIECFRVRESDPRSGEVTRLWIDDDGAFVRLVQEGGRVLQRVDRTQAEAVPVRPAEHSVTTPSTPALERIMSAEGLHVDLHLQGDPDRPLPDFPTSPWSRALGVEGSDEDGWVVKLRLDAHDDPSASATLPLDVEGLERHLESTVLMPCRHERIEEIAREAVGDETNARSAAGRLARWVFENVEKESPEVAQASALEILEDGRGDCSEHALLFVTLCRAVGIPARYCSGYVSVGSQWGAHAWAEIWVGRWIGADPTTGEVGTAARYLFFGYDDDPESFPGLVTARVRGRMRFVVTRVVEGADDYDLRDPERWRIQDREKGRYVHVLSGIEARDVPEDWVVRLVGTNRAFLRAEDLRVEMAAVADQGFTLEQWGGSNATFAGAPAQRRDVADRIVFRIHSRRRLVQMVVRSEAPDEKIALLERVLAPTFVSRPGMPLPAEPGPEDVEEAAAPEKPAQDAEKVPVPSEAE